MLFRLWGKMYINDVSFWCCRKRVILVLVSVCLMCDILRCVLLVIYRLNLFK